MIFDYFLYCPHCNASIDPNLGYLPEECPICHGIIRYTESGTRKGYFKSIKLPLLVQDSLVIILVLFAIIVVIFKLLPETKFYYRIFELLKSVFS